MVNHLSVENINLTSLKTYHNNAKVHQLNNLALIPPF